MAVTVSSMFIPVHDPDEALGSYRDALGVGVRMDVASEGFRWVTVGASGQDLDANFEEVRASGAEVLQEPASQPWGARVCAFRHPGGSLVRIAQA